MTVIKDQNNNNTEGEQKTRALLPPEGGASQPAASQPQQPQAQPVAAYSAGDDEEGYVNPNKPPQQSQPVAYSAGDDEEGYVNPNKPPAQPQPVAAYSTGDDEEGYVNPNKPPQQPAAQNNTNTTSAVADTTAADASNPTATKTPKPDQWQTKMLYDDGIDTKECLYGAFCFQCAQASAKADLDGSSWAWNCLCWHHGMTYSWLRSVYGIKSTCGSDMMSAIFCACCSGRRILSEVRIRGARPYTDTKEREEWTEDVFGCSTCAFIQSCVFPCCVGHDVRGMLHGKDELDCCFDFMCVNPCAMYGQVRHQYKLPAQFLPPTAEDICMACILYPCALNQAKRELAVIKGQ